MAEDEGYTIDRDEYAFLRGFTTDFILAQVLREIIFSKPESDRAAFVEKLQDEARQFNEALNSEPSARDRAWKAEMAQAFAQLYATALSGKF